MESGQIRIFTSVGNVLHYERFFVDNPHLPEGAIRKTPLLGAGVKAVGELYNKALEGLSGSENSWLIFCPDYFEFLADPADCLKSASRDCLYGVFGLSRKANLEGRAYCEHAGALRVFLQEGQGDVILGLDCPDGVGVDFLSAGFLAVHSSLALKCGLRFDSQFTGAFHVEDFCLRAGQEHGLQAKILHFGGAVRKPLSEFAEQAANSEDCARFLAKHGTRTPCIFIGGVGVETLLPIAEAPPDNLAYQREITAAQINEPAVLALPFMRPGAKVLDVGCSYGDNGKFFCERMKARLWGMEYDKAAIEVAAAKNIYSEVSRVNLEAFYPLEYSRYYGFFDYIFLGDVLEHLREPLAALKKCLFFLNESGRVIASIPNVAHQYVISSLLAGNFEYDACGLLDKTHLRFFTARSQADLYAKAGLRIESATCSFMGPDKFTAWPTPKFLPADLLDYMEKNRHFFVLQYICSLVPDEAGETELLEHNLSVLDRAPANNAPGWAETEELIAVFRRGSGRN